MISIAKQSCPQWLNENKDAKTREYRAAPPGNKPSPWRVPPVLDALREECSEKCIYCEGAVDDVAYIAVEHIRPKERFPELVLEWENLGLACTRCNTNKGAYWTDTDELRLVNPYDDRPEDHVTFCGPVAVPVKDSSRGENTIRRLRLTRDDLVLSRMRRIEDLDLRIRLWRSESDPERKELFAEDVSLAIAPDQEFSASLTAFAAYRGFPV